MRRLIAGVAALAFVPVIAGAQGAPGAPEMQRAAVPQIVTSAQGEARATPDRATIMIGVETRAATAADAAAQNSRKQRAVIAAIRAKGVAPEMIRTSGFNVIPETRYIQGQEPRTTSYRVTNVVTVDVRRIDLVGPVIDAALGSGSNQINSLTFGFSAADSLRRVALADAVTKARADADAMARAAGGSLGQLLELTASDVMQPPPRPFMAMAVAEADRSSVPIQAGEEAIRAGVTARWQFVSGPSR